MISRACALVAKWCRDSTWCSRVEKNGTVTLIGMCSGAVGFGAVAMDQLWVVGILGGSVERGNLTQDSEAFGDLGSPSGRAEQMPSGTKMCGEAIQRAQLGSGSINASLI